MRHDTWFLRFVRSWWDIYDVVFRCEFLWKSSYTCFWENDDV